MSPLTILKNITNLCFVRLSCSVSHPNSARRFSIQALLLYGLLRCVFILIVFCIRWSSCPNHYITKTCLYNFDPLKPHFYIVKLWFTWVYIIFLISAQIHRLWYSLEPPRRGGSNEYPQSMFWAEIWKISEFFVWIFFSFWRWIFLYIWIGVFSYWSLYSSRRVYEAYIDFF